MRYEAIDITEGIFTKENEQKAEISALRHNLSVAKEKNKELKTQVRVCADSAEIILNKNKQLEKKVARLTIEVEKIYSRYEILDL